MRERSGKGQRRRSEESRPPPGPGCTRATLPAVILASRTSSQIGTRAPHTGNEGRDASIVRARRARGNWGKSWTGKFPRWRPRPGASAIHLAPLPGPEAGDAVGADGGADEAQRRVAHGGGHPAHLPVTTFAEPDLEPCGRDGCAPADRRLPRPQVLGLRDQPDAGGPGASVREQHAAPQSL